jgi:probable phosphoglycerate mutase
MSSGVQVISSPLGRAVQTAEIMCETAGFAGRLETEPRLREIGMGSWDGLTEVEIDEEFPHLRSTVDRWSWYFQSPDGETYPQFAARLTEWLREAVGRTGAIVAVSHGVATRVLRGAYMSMAPEAALRLPVPQNVVYRLADGRLEEFFTDEVAPTNSGDVES